MSDLKPCPFCGTDDDIDPTGVLNGDGTRSPECMGCGATAPTVATWNCRIAAPSEDVRAVEDEPVAEYQVRTRSADREGDEGWYPWEKCGELNYADYVRVPVLHGWEYQTRKLYRRPQRPVVFPASCDGITWKATGDANFYRLMKDGDWFAVMQFNGQPPVAAHEAFLNSLFGPEEGGR